MFQELFPFVKVVEKKHGLYPYTLSSLNISGIYSLKGTDKKFKNFKALQVHTLGSNGRKSFIKEKSV